MQQVGSTAQFVQVDNSGLMPASIFATARPVSAPGGRAALRASTGLPTGRPVETVMHLLRNYFGARPNTALVGAFREQDQDRSGRFSVLEFKAALRALNVDVTEGEAEDVFRHLDADGSGVLELSEFVNAMKAEAPPEETRWLRFGVGHHYVAPTPEPPDEQSPPPPVKVNGPCQVNRAPVVSNAALALAA